MDEAADPPQALDWEKAVDFEVKITAPGTTALARTFTVRFKGHSDVVVADEHIYPVWVDQADPDALKEWRGHWSANIEQARTTSKWVASILGAVLALIVGTAPLTGLTGRGPFAWVLAIAGILFALVVLALTLRVLAPTAIGIADVYPDGSKVGALSRVLRPRLALRRLGERLEANGGVELPLGIRTIAELVGRIRLEEVTLGALAPMITEPNDTAPAMLERAQKARGQIYASLQQDVAEILALAQFELVRARASLARRAGFVGGTLAVVLLAGALLQPLAAQQFRLADRVDPSTTLARSLLGPDCDTFEAVVTGSKAPPDSTAIGAVTDSGKADGKTSWTNLSVRRSDHCHDATITLPAADLVRTG